jgi:uncharacterized protein (TIGR03083 family)
MGTDHLGLIRTDTAALVATVRRGPADAAVAACPGWDLVRLAGHVGRVHRWATAAAEARTAPAPGGDRPPGDAEGVAAYLEAGVGPLLAALAALDPAEPCWNFTRGPQVGAFWPRRQALETAVHRWDAQHAVGPADPIDAGLAIEGVDEVLDVLAPTGIGARDGIDIGGSIHLHVTDADGEWTLRTDDGVLSVARGHAKGDAAVRGPASALLLLLWRRIRPTEAGLELFGDQAVLDRWLALGVP